MLRTTETKPFEADRSIQNVQADLDLALILLANASILYERLEEIDRARLLKILAKRIIVNPDGLIVDQELLSPFTYLRNLAGSSGGSHRDSEQVRSGAQEEAVSRPLSAFRFKKGRSPHRGLCLSSSGAPKPVYPEQHSEDEQFIDQIRFDQRSKLAELPDIWKKVGRDDLLR